MLQLPGSFTHFVWKTNRANCYGIYNSERFEPRWVDVVVWVIIWVCSVVLRTVVGVDWCFNNLSGSHHHSDDGFCSGCQNVSQHQQQSFSGLHYKPGRSLKPQHCYGILMRVKNWIRKKMHKTWILVAKVNYLVTLSYECPICSISLWQILLLVYDQCSCHFYWFKNGRRHERLILYNVN